jgi:hypothetical protein
MRRKKATPFPPEMSKALEKFNHWRKTRKSRKPIPEELWQVAVNLSGTFSVNQIAKTLRLNHSELKRRITGTVTNPSNSNTFIELDLSSSFCQTSECVVEMTDRAGTHMKMYFKGDASIDLLELGKTFLDRLQ